MRIDAWPPATPPRKPPPPPKPRASAEEVVVRRLATPSAATAAMANIEVRSLNMGLSSGFSRGANWIVRLLVAPAPRVGSPALRENRHLISGAWRSSAVHLAETTGG